MHSSRKFYWTVFWVWIGWAAAILLYQVMISARLEIAAPDYALNWTPSETEPNSQQGKPYLNEPFMNSQVSWDSEYYLAIAVYGYEDPSIFRINTAAEAASRDSGVWPFKIPVKPGEPILPGVPLSYAFFPFYPIVVRIFSYPLSVLGLNEIATATLSGVLVSILGTLLGMISLYELAKEELGGRSGRVESSFLPGHFPSRIFPRASVYRGIICWPGIQLTADEPKKKTWPGCSPGSHGDFYTRGRNRPRSPLIALLGPGAGVA